MEESEAIRFLESLLDKTMRIHIPDGRMFVGTFRCTDNESNVILSNAFEYRMPSKEAERLALEKAAVEGGVSKADMTSRFLGMIVIPGKQISKMEVEERLPPPQTTLSVRKKALNEKAEQLPG